VRSSSSTPPAALSSAPSRCNPESLKRSYQVQGVGGDGGGERAQPFRLKGLAIETITLEADMNTPQAFPTQKLICKDTRGTVTLTEIIR
jgi:hypothetical protein